MDPQPQPAAGPEPEPSELEEPVALELWEALAGREAAVLLAEFLRDEKGPGELLLPPGANRQQRKRQHALLRTHFPTVFSESVKQRVRVRRQGPIKCVAVDLDNTIWPGVLLETLGAWQLPDQEAQAPRMSIDLYGAAWFSQGDTSPGPDAEIVRRAAPA